MPIASVRLSSSQYLSDLKITVNCLNIWCIAAKTQLAASILRFPEPAEKEKQIALLDIKLFEMRFCLIDLAKGRNPVLWILPYACSYIRVQMASCDVNP